MSAYYNEIDPYAAQWLRNLIAAGHIAPGDVDERSIEDVRPDDLRGYTQCHFFAGIGVWSHALRRAGWPDDRPVWTGSCPCQPFSAAGKGVGFDDERHLWPAWHWLIGECRPAVVFGEQVASSAVDPWIDLVQADVEAMGYAFGCVPFPAAGVDAPNIRERAYWLAYANGMRLPGIGRRRQDRVAEHREAGRVANTTSKRHAQRDGFPSAPEGRSGSGAEAVRHGSSVGLADHHGDRLTAQSGRELHHAEHHAQPCGGSGRLADAASAGRRERCADALRSGERSSAEGLEQRTGGVRFLGRSEPAGPADSFWRAADWLLCRDGKWRPVEPGTFPLVDGAPSRVGRLRAYGNAINAEAARAFIETCIDLI
ncbi:DNA cytosine methyltransferase [Burkholderia gladioli]|uniref:DNA cytosine methyltransferase n=1 Tax=Burkholderia gladioli TaxID=28095 RepID=UPI0016417063|nr:DNA cytosine methyltransferase [Burkholderia gladioli]